MHNSTLSSRVARLAPFVTTKTPIWSHCAPFNPSILWRSRMSHAALVNEYYEYVVAFTVFTSTLKLCRLLSFQRAFMQIAATIRLCYIGLRDGETDGGGWCQGLGFPEPSFQKKCQTSSNDRFDQSFCSTFKPWYSRQTLLNVRFF